MTSSQLTQRFLLEDEFSFVLSLLFFFLPWSYFIYFAHFYPLLFYLFLLVVSLF